MKQPTPAIPHIDQQDDIQIAVALSEFSINYEDADPEINEHARQLVADHLINHDVGPSEAVYALAIGDREGELKNQRDTVSYRLRDRLIDYFTRTNIMF